jgi:hypothetical protein
MRFSRNRKSGSGERGIALMIALLAIVLLACIGVALMYMADTENSINNNYRDSQRAYFAARAGAENVRVLLAQGGTLNAQAAAMIGMPTPGTLTNVLYVLNPNATETINSNAIISGTSVADNAYIDDELCQEQFVNLVNGGSPLTPMVTAAGSPPPPCAGGGHIPAATTYFTPVTLTTADVPGTGNANSLDFKWVRITNKQNYMGLVNQKVDTAASNDSKICWNGTKEIAVPPTTDCTTLTPVAEPVWLLTSLALTSKVGNNPGSRRMVQTEVALNPPLMAPAPISTQAPVQLQGSFILDAYDNCTCTCASLPDSHGNISYSDCPNKAGCNKTAHAIFTGGSVNVNGGAGNTTSAFGNDPTGNASIQNVDPWPYNIDDLITQYKAGAQIAPYSCTGTASFFTAPPTYKNCGTQSSQNFGTYPSGLPVEPLPGTFTSVTEYVPGSVKLTSAATGSGILIVDGDLEINGGLNWYGLLLVRGKVSFTGGAGQDVNLYGSVLAGQDVNATDQAQSDNFGGSINFHWDVCAMKNLNSGRPPRMLATHELAF